MDWSYWRNHRATWECLFGGYWNEGREEGGSSFSHCTDLYCFPMYNMRIRSDIVIIRIIITIRYCLQSALLYFDHGTRSMPSPNEVCGIDATLIIIIIIHQLLSIRIEKHMFAVSTWWYFLLCAETQPWSCCINFLSVLITLASIAQLMEFLGRKTIIIQPFKKVFHYIFLLFILYL